MNSILDFALGMLQNNPQVSNNPNAQTMIEVIKNNDSTRGQQIAENILRTRGLTREQGLEQARSFFHI